MTRIPLIILGAGNVGRALIRQLLEAAPLHAARDGLALPIVAWCDRAGALVEPDGLAPETLAAAEVTKAGGASLAELPQGYHQHDLTAIVDVAGTDGCVVVDVTASADTAPAVTAWPRPTKSPWPARRRPSTGWSGVAGSVTSPRSGPPCR